MEVSIRQLLTIFVVVFLRETGDSTKLCLDLCNIIPLDVVKRLYDLYLGYEGVPVFEDNKIQKMMTFARYCKLDSILGLIEEIENNRWFGLEVTEEEKRILSKYVNLETFEPQM